MLLFLLITGITCGQNKITGQLLDTSLPLPLPNVSACLLSAKDSFIVTDTRTNKNGFFELKNIKDGDYLLLFTYPGYVDLFQPAQCKSDSTSIINLGIVSLMTKGHLLADVIIKSKSASAIVIRGDTTEYTADSFKVDKNANVETLLKQLPGIQIDPYGHIKGQGKDVHKVLVDGEEFFGSDPLLVTRNLRADMVDKVQLFDQKTDRAIFTGIDDGIKNKTINITLKQNKKNGAFGKIEASAGTNNIYGSRAMVNAFKGAQKAAAYLTVANNGVTDLSSSDQGTFGSIAGGSGQFQGEGLPTSISTGGHYNNSWQHHSTTFNGDYKYNQLQIKNQSSTTDQNFLPEDAYIITRSDLQSHNSKSLHLINMSSDIKLDSSSSLKIAANGQLENTLNRSNTRSAAYNQNQLLLNNTDAANTNKTNSQYLNTSAYWTKRFHKDKRTLSAMVNLVQNNRTGSGSQNATNHFYSTKAANVPDSSQYIDLIKHSSYHLDQFSANITYTEPVSKSLSFIANYGYDGFKTRSNINAFDQLQGANTENIDSLYSNHFIYRQINNHLGLDFSYGKKKVLLSFGNHFNQQKLEQVNLFKDSAFTKTYLNMAPHVNLTLNLSSQKSFNVHYDGASTLPSVYQLQPIVDNTDPLYLVVGNAQLKPSFSNKLSASYTAYNTKSDQYFTINMSYNLTSHGITSNISTDATTGKTLMSYLNINNRFNTHFYSAGTYSFGVSKSQKLKLSVSAEVQNSKYFNFINGVQNAMHAKSYALALGLDKTRTSTYDFNISNTLGYIINKASLQNALHNNYLQSNSTLSFNYYLPAHFQLHTDLDYVWQDKTNQYTTSFNRLLLNSWIGKKFLKNEQLLIKISANDIFNQNTGFSRNAYNNIVTQHSFLTIGRNFGVSVIWDFKKFKSEK